MKGTLNYEIRQLKNSRGSIQLVHRFGRNKVVVYSTGIKIDPIKHWNHRKQRVKLITAQKNAARTNRFLDEKSSEANKKLTELAFSNPNYSKVDVIRIFDELFGKRKKRNNFQNLLECYEWYFEHFSKNPTTSTQRPLSNGTARSFKRSFKIFKTFSLSKGNLQYEDITMEFYEEFLDYLRGYDYSNNYIANHIKNLKTIMNYALLRGYHNNLTFKRRDFAKPNEEVDAVYLNTEELKKIASLDLPKGQSVCRDLFLIGAYTGLRVSDFNRLEKENIKIIDGRYYVEILSKKSNKMLLIPCHPTVVNILKKYGNNPPPRKPDQNINRDLKLIGEKAELFEEVSITKTIGGVRTSNYYKKYELISTHTARRSFCTNAYYADMPTLDIMTISGHKTEKAFYTYIKASSLDKAKKIGQHPFFNQ